MIWAPYFERSTIISNTCAVRYAYICADVAIIEDYCYARCLPVSPAAPYCRCSQPARKLGLHDQVTLIITTKLLLIQSDLHDLVHAIISG